MKNAIILHGMKTKEQFYSKSAPSPSNDHWVPWLQKQLLVRDIHAHTPEVPNSWLPEYSKWKREFERYDISNETILVGHSCGGGFLVRWLSENKNICPLKVVLVAPWLDIEGNIPEDIDMFKFSIDPEIVNRTELVVLNSDDDMKEIKSTLVKLKEEIPGLKVVDFHNKGHFCKNDLGGVEFPELLTEVLK
jgi:predicted alpha/beta hydrolase family esterase